MPFRKDFVWGVASSSYQVEGAAAAGGRGPSVWDMVTHDHPTFRVVDRSSGDTACDAYNRLDEDADLVAGLGVKAYRFSIAWPRVLPRGDGEPNEAGLTYYDRLVDALLDRGVQPWVTLFHWDYPLALYDRGGWLNADSPAWFEDYASLMARLLGDRVTHWMTINEPQCSVALGHAFGEHAPGLRLPAREVLTVCHNTLLAHGRAVRAIRSACPGASIGWAPVGEPCYPVDEQRENIDAARSAMFGVPNRGDQRHGIPGALPFFNNAWYADPVMLGDYPRDGAWDAFHLHLPEPAPGDMEIISQPVDFFGVNIYQGFPVRADENGDATPVPFPTGHPRTAMGWPVTPEALYWGPRFFAERYKRPIVITENGCATTDWLHGDGTIPDTSRIDFLRRYLGQLRRATDDGVDVLGYMQWCLMDNFEWAEGYTKRFGLIHCDFESGARTPKASYAWYRDVIRANGSGDSLNARPRALP